MATVDRRRAGVEWNITDENGAPYAHLRGGAALAVLMDIRDELKRLNAVLACPNFLAIPHKLDEIAAQTKKRTYTRRNT